MRTAESYIGWLDYSEAERRRMLDVVELLGENDTVDELGIGTVRDALADRLFPGTSTLQTRARYFLFIPWIFQELEAERPKPRAASRRLRAMEAELIDALRAGEENTRGAGIVGIERGIQTMRLPSSIYWNGLRVLKIRAFEGSIEQYLRSIASFTRRVAQVLKGDGDELVERPARRWDEVPEPPNGWLDSTTMALRSDEADYLSQRLATAVPGTVFAHLAARRIRPTQNETFVWDSSARASLPPVLQDQIEHARLFSLVMHGALLLYNFELAVLVDDDELEETYSAELQDWMDRIRRERASLDTWRRDAFWALVYDTRGWVKGPVKAFIDRWIDLALSGQDVRPAGEARRLIAEREKRLKGNLSRIANQRARDRWNRASGTGQLDFRWRTASRLLRDIAPVRAS